MTPLNFSTGSNPVKIAFLKEDLTFKLQNEKSFKSFVIFEKFYILLLSFLVLIIVLMTGNKKLIVLVGTMLSIILIILYALENSHNDRKIKKISKIQRSDLSWEQLRENFKEYRAELQRRDLYIKANLEKSKFSKARRFLKFAKNKLISVAESKPYLVFVIGGIYPILKNYAVSSVVTNVVMPVVAPIVKPIVGPIAKRIIGFAIATPTVILIRKRVRRLQQVKIIRKAGAIIAAKLAAEAAAAEKKKPSVLEPIKYVILSPVIETNPDAKLPSTEFYVDKIACLSYFSGLLYSMLILFY